MRRDAQPGQPQAAPDEGSGAPAARRTQAGVSATDAISDALEAAEAEEKRTADHAASGARLLQRHASGIGQVGCGPRAPQPPHPVSGCSIQPHSVSVELHDTVDFSVARRQQQSTGGDCTEAGHGPMAH